MIEGEYIKALNVACERYHMRLALCIWDKLNYEDKIQVSSDSLDRLMIYHVMRSQMDRSDKYWEQEVYAIRRIISDQIAREEKK